AIAEAMDQSDVVILGEEHDDPLAHRLERTFLEMAAKRAKARPIALSLEMFERDVQLVMDEYLTGLIREKDFLAAARPWKNYEPDYRPLVELARTEGLAVIAANAPGRYVSRVGRLGAASLAALPFEARAYLAPLPYAAASKAYAEKFRARIGPMAANPDHHTHHPPLAADLLEAQVLRDATMAHAIARHLEKQKSGLVLHVNGRFHSDERLGVPEHLARYLPEARVVVVTLATTETGQPEGGAATDFVIVKAAPSGTPPAPARTSPPAPADRR
ncbi:MAG: ChaN family lipoprotein, partial [Candidatus Sericytochromatia bacterium]